MSTEVLSSMGGVQSEHVDVIDVESDEPVAAIEGSES